MNPVVRPIFILIVWIAWLLPFFVQRPKHPQKAVRIETAARWGIVTQAIGFFLTYAHRPEVWASDFPAWRLVCAAIPAAAAILVAWTAVPALGKQWRVDAGLNADHELVRSGPYRVVRHPIYASMLCMLLMGIAAVGTLPGWPVALLLGFAGTEIRVRVEDRLLRGRFQDRFVEWQQRVPAYIPFVR